jgi:hypothetical protein
MTHHHLKVFGDDHVQFQKGDAQIQGMLKGREGVFGH